MIVPARFQGALYTKKASHAPTPGTGIKTIEDRVLPI